MSASTKRPAAIAGRDARELLKLIVWEKSWTDYAWKWTLAGSIRRKRPEVGDVEHVVVPRMGEVRRRGDGLLFDAQPAEGNLLWERLDELVRDKVIGKWWNGRSETWGERYRRVEFRGFCHDFFAADFVNYGSTLLIRTGPAEFSKSWVTLLRDRGLRHVKGRVIRETGLRCPSCDWRGDAEDTEDPLGEGACPSCGRSGGKWLPVVEPTPDEATAFRLVGYDFVPHPEQRDDAVLSGTAGGSREVKHG